LQAYYYMQKEEDLELFLKDLELDGIDLSDLSCSDKNHKLENCEICRFFDSCPYPNSDNIDKV